ncbi:Uncharacterised protein [Mycobacteroides abscessus subsp. massiliense]|nr:Uncharacterised protein [Mycobacteroides abscessus subsp. massiliense]
MIASTAPFEAVYTSELAGVKLVTLDPMLTMLEPGPRALPSASVIVMVRPKTFRPNWR